MRYIKLILLFLCCGLLVSCTSDPEEKTRNPLCDEIVFESRTFAYDGNPHSIKCSYVPEGLIVRYGGNNNVEVGTYVVVAFVYDEDGNELTRIQRTMEIVEVDEIIDCSKVVFNPLTLTFDGKPHTVSCTNLPSGVRAVYQGNFVKSIGTHEVTAFLVNENGVVIHTITTTITIEPIDVNDFEFKSIIVKYTGEPYSIECSGVPSSINVRYEGNGVSEIGIHKVVAIFTDENNVEIGRREATITINDVQATVPDEGDRWKGEIAVDTTLFNNAKLVRISSFASGNDEPTIYLKQYAPYDDEYVFKTDSNTTVELYSPSGVAIAVIEPKQTYSLELFEGEEILTVIKAMDTTVSILYTVNLVENKSLFPYDPQEMVDAEALLKDSKKDEKLTNVSSTIEYKKREGGLYINCNNPEQLTNHCLHNALTRNDVSNKSVFFTFEHNNAASNPDFRIQGSFYYGYQVINRGTEDVYITVKNIGYHVDGPGCWLGEKEWIDFYNTKFLVKNYNMYTASQLKTFNDYYGFSNNYKDPDYQAITYRLPAGEYMYVMGGTTKDAYNNNNVFDTANYKVAVNGCSNGAVLFEVAGDNVEGVFYAYQDTNKIQPNNNSLQGYVVTYPGSDQNFGFQYVGHDDCHGVVDSHLTWEFNDTTPAGYLKVNYNRPVSASVVTGKQYAYQAISTSFAWLNNQTSWATHINPLNARDAVGTDMTKYYTINSEGEDIVIDYAHLDGNGNTVNIGNWMMDYMEHYTFVNHGDRDRKITVGFNNSGSVAVLVRDAEGKLIEGTPQYTIVSNPGGSYGAINDRFSYTVTVPANGYVQFVVEYNLLANSNGYVKHTVEIK